MHAERKFHEPSPGSDARAYAAPRWSGVRRVAGFPPAIEEWLRASRARLLRRYGGVIPVPTAATRYCR